MKKKAESSLPNQDGDAKSRTSQYSLPSDVAMGLRRPIRADLDAKTVRAAQKRMAALWPKVMSEFGPSD